MNKKIKIFLFLLAILIIGIIAFVINKNFNKKIEDYEINLNEISFKNEIDLALKKVDKNKLSKVIKDKNINENEVVILFEEVNDEEIVKKIIKVLKKYNGKGTFIVSGMDGIENINILKSINKSGNEIGNGTLNKRSSMELLSEEDIIKEIVVTNEIIKSSVKVKPNYLKLKNSNVNNKILYLTKASDLEYVIDNEHYISYQSFKSYDEVYNYIKNISNGSIISIKLEGVLSELEYHRDENSDKKAEDKKSTIKDEEKINEEISILQIIEWIFKALKENNKSSIDMTTFISREEIENTLYKREAAEEKNKLLNREDLFEDILKNNNNSQVKNEKTYKALKEEDIIKIKEALTKNNNEMSQYINRFYTTLDSVSYTFRNIENEIFLEKLLNLLDEINVKATFFVTKNDIKNNYSSIKKIISRGHEVGNGGITNNSKLLEMSSEEILKEIVEVNELLNEKGITTSQYMAGSGFVDDEILISTSALNLIEGYENYELFTYSKAPFNSNFKGYLAEDLVKEYFNLNSYMALSRGEIIYFNLGSRSYIEEEELLNSIKIIKERYIDKCYVYKMNESEYSLESINLNYSVVPLSSLQNSYENKENLGRYNLYYDFKDLEKRTIDFEFLKDRYIGNKNVILSDVSEEEKLSLDTTGTIDTNGISTIFITIDDFGNEGIVNNILNVLEKNNVKATFFPTAIGVDIEERSNANPNLLRLIALKGHEIGSHNYNHELVSFLTEEDKKILNLAYNLINRVVGDTGRFVKILRPPTLSVSKYGLELVLESGFDYVVNGNISTKDYEATSIESILSSVEENLIKGKGNVIIMHCNNQSYYTAEALDKLLKNNKEGKYGDVYEIRLLSDYLK